MKKSEFKKLEDYMLVCMKDSAHDKEHVYRVLYTALDIAQYEEADKDVLIAACLLHDIGRQEQFADPRLCHAAVGARKARAFLLKNGYGEEFADHVAECVKAHRYRTGIVPQSIEAKVLFDADKLDVTGAIGIARTLLYEGQVGRAIYSLNEEGEILDGGRDKEPSFFQEYRYKLEHLYEKFYTARGRELAEQRQPIARQFYESMLREVRQSYGGRRLLADEIS